MYFQERTQLYTYNIVILKGKYKIGIKYFQQRYLLIQEEQVNCK
jgi:hypothetical protein